MTLHELKSWPIGFQAVVDRIKTAEFRLNDRGYCPGDVVLLREYREPTPTVSDGGYTGRMQLAEIMAVEEGAFGIPDGYVVLSIKTIGDVRMGK